MHRETSSSLTALLLSAFSCVPGALAAEQPIAIFHAFDQSFNVINSFVCQLARQGYSHIQIPPAQKSNNKHPNHWYYRYQPVDYSVIEGRGSESDLKNLIDKAASCNPPIKVIADVVFNHMASINDGFSTTSFAGLSPQDFNNRCPINYQDGNRQTEQNCWMGKTQDLPDLDQSRSNVNTVHKKHLKKLIDLGIGGFRFDAAKHMPEVAVKEYIDYIDAESKGNTWNYLEVIQDQDTKAGDYGSIAAVTDFVLYRSMKNGFTFSGDLRAFPPNDVPDPRSVTFGENHDTIKQISAEALEPYDDRTDAHLATAFVLARESGTPLVFNDDNLMVPYIPTGVRFRRIMHERRNAGLSVKENILRVIDSPTLLIMERGAEGFFVLNKAKEEFDIAALDLTLTNLEGCYRELRNDFTVAIEQRDGKKFVTRWGTWSRGGMEVSGRDALFFVREPFSVCQ